MPGEFSLGQLVDSGQMSNSLYNQLFAAQDFTGLGDGFGGGNARWFGPGEFLGEGGWSQGNQIGGFQGNWFDSVDGGGVNESGAAFMGGVGSPNQRALDAYKNYTFNYTPGEDGAASLQSYNPQGNLSGTYNQRGQTGLNKLVSKVAPMLGTMAFGGAFAPLFGGGALGAAAGNAAASGAMTGMRGGNLGQIGSAMLSSGISGGLGAYNPAGQMGLEGGLAKTVNSGLGGALSAAAKGGNVLQGGLSAMANTGLNQMGSFTDLFNSFSSPEEEGLSFEYAQPDNEMSLGDYAQPEDVSFGFDQSLPSAEWSLPAQGMQTAQGVDNGLFSNPFSSFMPSNMGSSVGNFINNNTGDLASMLYGFYNNKKQQRALQGQQQQAQQSLESLYGQNSPYAQQLRANLQAKAAAGGKRLNTSGRETQLQAMLADRSAQHQAAMGPQMYQNQMAQNNLKNNNMNMLLQGANKMGLFKQAGQGLQGIFGPSPVMQNNQPFQNYFGDYNSLGGNQ